MPKCQYCGLELSENVLPVHEQWCKAQKEDKKDTNQKSVSDLNADDAIKLVSTCEDIELLNKWLEEEKEDKSRVTVLKAIESRIKEPEDPEGDDA